MKIHHLNCGTMKPRGTRYLIPQMVTVPCHCLLIELAEQLVLIDSGLGTRDMEDPRRLGISDHILHACPNLEQTAVHQIEKLGFQTKDVQHIICTHLDRDHAGGLSDFPAARVHVLRAEYEAALAPRGFRERERYRRCHFAHGPRWVTHQRLSSESWFGMDCIREVPGLTRELLLVPLPGHTRGHCGVAVDSGDGWLLHCGDAFYSKLELAQTPGVPLGLRSFRRIAHLDHSKAMLQIQRVNKAVRASAGKITLLASHAACSHLGRTA